MSGIARIRYDNYDWNGAFNLNEYVNNPTAIRQLYESCLIASKQWEDCQEKGESLQRQVSELDKQNALLSKDISTQKEQSRLALVFQFLAVIFTGIGVNLLTNEQSNGWLYLVLAASLEIATLYLKRSVLK